MTNAATLSNASIQAQGQSMTNAATLSNASIQVMSSSGRLGNNMVWLIRGLRYAKLTNRDYLLVNISKKDKREYTGKINLIDLAGSERLSKS